MNHPNSPLLAVLLAVFLGLSACDSTDPIEEGPGEEEQITTVVLTLTPSSGGSTAEYRWSDTDGDGGAAPIVDEVMILSGLAYDGTISFLDESDPSDIDDITTEVSEEAEEHQVFTTVEGDIANETTITVTDQDANNLPLGLDFTLVTTADPAATGTLRVVLSHYDDVAKDGTTRSPETDVEVTFDVTVLAP